MFILSYANKQLGLGRHRERRGGLVRVRALKTHLLALAHIVGLALAVSARHHRLVHRPAYIARVPVLVVKLV
jgi:hypothetical protein